MNIQLARFILDRPGGFVISEDMPQVIALDRLQPLLVRCGGCRFTAAAQDVRIITRALEAAGDYVRDVSFPASACAEARATVAAARTPAPAPAAPARDNGEQHATPAARVEPARRELPPVPFRESECGGVFDGFQVTSDADPGL